MTKSMSATPRGAAATIFCALTLGTLPAEVSAATTVNLYGTLSNFDVYNDTGGEACGFEIEIPGGTQTAGYYGTYTSYRYGTPAVQVTPTGVSIFYAARWDASTHSYVATGYGAGTMPACTQPATGIRPTQGHQCTASSDGCEHFGAYSASFGDQFNYYWLIPDPANPGQLVRAGTSVPIPTVNWTPVDPVVAGGDPVVVAAVEAPEPAEQPDQYGDAQWIKVYKTRLDHEVVIDDLLSDNPIVPMDLAQLEVSWDVIQDVPVNGGGGKQNRKRKQGQDNVKVGDRAIVRRYEMYTYTGAYDPLTHEALCQDLTCSAPADNEVGDYIGAQMAAANLHVKGVKITKTGPGSVSSNEPKFSCGNVCSVTAAEGSQMTLSAKADSGAVFTGWTGACAGNQADCTVTVNDETEVGAIFAQAYSVSVSSNNSGSVTADQGGINCGKNCSAKIAAGTKINFTAIPLPGKTFLNWTAGCTGTSPICSVTVNASLSVKAAFSK